LRKSRPSVKEVEAGTFHKISRIDDSRLAEIFAREVLGFLVHKELLNPEWAAAAVSGAPLLR
jgi:hypothetical protein